MTNARYYFSLCILLFLPIMLFADPPVAQADTAVTFEDIAVNIPVLGNDSDPDGDLDPTSVTVTDPPSNGITTVNADGTITYEPDPDFEGTDTFTYQVCDETTPVLCDEATVIVEVSPVDDPPVANDDPVTTPEDTPVMIPVTGNDSDPDGNLDPTSITVTDPPSNGTATVIPDGTITYEPDPDYNGPDSFTYEICDTTTPTPLCDEATVTIDVTPVGDPPVANDDLATTPADVPIVIPVLNNDSGDLDPSTVIVISGPDNGTAVVNPDGTITYTSDPSLDGLDTFSYQVCDTGIPPLCDVAVVSVTTIFIPSCLSIICPLYYREPSLPQQTQETYTTSGINYCVRILSSNPNIGLLRFKPGLTGVDINSEAEYLFEYEYYGNVCPIEFDFTINYEICSGACSTGSSFCALHKVNLDFGGYVDCHGNAVCNPCSAFTAAPVAPGQFGFATSGTAGLPQILSLEDCSSVDVNSIAIINQPNSGEVLLTTDGAISYTPDFAFVGVESIELSTNEGPFTLYFFSCLNAGIPTLSEWGMLVLALLMLGLAWVHLR